MSFRLQSVELVCPTCRGALSERHDATEAELTCEGCGKRYPLVCGIPDLRIFPDPYISFEGDRTKARMLHSRFGDLDFAGIVALYYHITPETPPHDVVSNTTRLLNAVGRAEATLAGWDTSFGEVRGETLLDVGCGTAPLLVASRSRFRQAIGIDVGMRWLVVAKRRLLELGVEAPQVAACGEALPFRDGTFDAVTMDSFLEIAKDADAAAREAHRVLRPRGRIYVQTPNRFSIGPDPHIGVPAGGYLPQGIVNTIAKQKMARPPLRHFFSYASLGRALRRGGFARVRTQLPAVSDGQRAQFGGFGRRAADWYNTLRTQPVTKQLLMAVGPMLHGTGERE
jgi:SAM-dependent methyltransferase/uncharacterized protein YbaR (Trm112 family)